MYSSFGILILAGLCIVWLPSGQAKGNPWEKVKSVDGVEVFEKKEDGRLAFRGIGEIRGNPAKLVGILEKLQ